MNTHLRPIPKFIAAGACLSLLAILFGFALGGAFGVVEDSIKKRLDDSGSAALQSAYAGDVAAKEAVVKKSWDYMKRAHMHGGAIGTAALASIAMLMLLCHLGLAAQLSAMAFGSGALLYSVFWLLAGFAAPGLGSTSAAKESLWWIAIPGASLSMLGICGTIYCVLKACCLKSDEA